jgi:hypothetical protein
VNGRPEWNGHPKHADFSFGEGEQAACRRKGVNQVQARFPQIAAPGVEVHAHRRFHHDLAQLVRR